MAEWWENYFGMSREQMADQAQGYPEGRARNSDIISSKASGGTRQNINTETLRHGDPSRINPALKPGHSPVGGVNVYGDDLGFQRPRWQPAVEAGARWAEIMGQSPLDSDYGRRWADLREMQAGEAFDPQIGLIQARDALVRNEVAQAADLLAQRADAGPQVTPHALRAQRNLAAQQLAQRAGAMTPADLMAATQRGVGLETAGMGAAGAEQLAASQAAIGGQRVLSRGDVARAEGRTQEADAQAAFEQAREQAALDALNMGITDKLGRGEDMMKIRGALIPGAPPVNSGDNATAAYLAGTGAFLTGVGSILGNDDIMGGGSVDAQGLSGEEYQDALADAKARNFWISQGGV